MLLKESYRYRPRYFTLNQGGQIRGCLPIIEVDSVITGKRGVSVSFSDHCHSVVADEKDFNLLFQSVLDYGRSRRWRYVEFRGEAMLSHEVAYQRFVQHTLPLEKDEATLHCRLRKSAARSIQKALKEGVRVEVSDGVNEVLSFYRLHCITRRRQGQPPQAKKYFIHLHKHLISKGFGFTALARHGENTVAGLICLHFGNKAIYKYGASDEQFQSLRANNLLFWEMIKKCANDGFTSLSFGRTDRDNDGLLIFKDGWGGERSELNYYRYDFSTDTFLPLGVRFHGYEKLFKKLPITLLRIVGTLGYRHMG
ncbi:GNAT family N-acetyltransferase [Geomonas paludis]|uniref:GNAT family N-acetyltransferase n=1 Tax=Geomonas paludis TaxID=2740185 RepID=A0ABY4LGC3_9BACT|nr:GNAT family N-acetyltransferase [Geomonas paludis]UPU37038.1 GNAT family N-acetyltransferase [Geomonas paludis]